MRNKPRDVTGGEELWGGMIPGFGLVNYILGLLTVPIEAFIRWNFGERYFTRANFMGGLVILIIWVIGAKLFAMINMFNPLMYLFNRRGGDDESGMGSVIKWYFIFSMFHFATIWWKDVIGRPKHSFWPGNSLFYYIGKGVMWVLNIFLGLFVRLIFLVFRLDKGRLSIILPVLYDTHTFTQRFIEPAFVFMWAFFCMAIGEYTMAWWLVFSFMALVTNTGLRHESERGVFLDYRDQMIEARNYSAFMEVGSTTSNTGNNLQEKIIQETAREVEKNPDVLTVIENKNPTLAKAIERISPRLKAIADQEKGPDTQPQAV